MISASTISESGSLSTPKSSASPISLSTTPASTASCSILLDSSSMFEPSSISFLVPASDERTGVSPMLSACCIAIAAAAVFMPSRSARIFMIFITISAAFSSGSRVTVSPSGRVTRRICVLGQNDACKASSLSSSSLSTSG